MTDPEYKFTGKEEDIEVGATYFGARYYNAHLGRFMSADPLTIHGLASDMNPYAYVGGRVMSHVDPLGLASGDAGANKSAQAAREAMVPGTNGQGPAQPPVTGTRDNGGGVTVTTTCPGCDLVTAYPADPMGGSSTAGAGLLGFVGPRVGNGLEATPDSSGQGVRLPPARAYGSPGEAGWAAASEYNGYSIDNAVELVWATYVKDGKHYHTPAVQNWDAHNSTSNVGAALELIPQGASATGIGHTHGVLDFEWKHPSWDGKYNRDLVRLGPGNWLASPVSPGDHAALQSLIARGILPGDAIHVVATSSAHIALFGASTPVGAETYLFNPSLFVNWQGIKPGWSGPWFYDSSNTLHAPGR